ncbi:MAG: sialate O-acetylesterase [Planctomycetota bacterium]
MTKLICLLIAWLIAVLLPTTALAQAERQPANGKLKVFVLAGQSNMQGFGRVVGDGPGTMQTYVKDNPDAYGHLVRRGDPVVRDDVWIVDLSQAGKERRGWLTTGYGVNANSIGPEYGFGFAVGDYYEDPVLIIKSAWGGRSLVHNFLPPSAGDYAEPQKDGDAGFHYAEVVRHVKEITGNLKRYYPDYDGEGYELVGFGWHQGWNDRINMAAVNVYEQNMAHFIRDMRRDLGVEDLLFVIANTGMGGWDIPDTASHKTRVEKLMEAQLALADAERHPEFAGSVAGVETRGFQRSREESPSGQNYHWRHNWETYYLIGTGMGQAIVALVQERG